MGSKEKTTEVRPSTIEEYVDWARKKHSIVFDERIAKVTETNARAILNEAYKNTFFEDLSDTLEHCAREYESEHSGARLLMRPVSDFELVAKPYQSMLNKSWRHNVIWNSRWPRPPRPRVAGLEQAEGWTTPENWYSRFDDIVRGTIVLRYIDGPRFLAEELAQYCSARGIKSSIEPRALDEGYYAFHFYVQVPVVLLKQDWSEFQEEVWIELQLTTQLQEAARDLTHSFYTVRRLETRRDNDWKWDHGSDRFKAAYISHSLHLIEGLIVELRDEIAKRAMDSNAKEVESESASPPAQDVLLASGENHHQSTELTGILPEEQSLEKRQSLGEAMSDKTNPEETREKTPNGQS